MDQTITLVTCITFFFLMLRSLCSSLDTITAFQNITDGETLVSGNERFELGFFSPGSSKNRYVGIWFKNTSPHTVVWVANRETPLIDTSGMVKLDSQGVLSIVNSGGTVIWSTNSSSVSYRTNVNPVALLLDTGNLVIKEENSVIWQSFDYPGDTSLPGTKLGKDLIPVGKVVWVANRETPLIDTSGMVKLDSQGVMSIVNSGGTVIWSTNSSSVSYRTNVNPVALLLDTGNLVIKEENSVIWQSFDYPGDTSLPGTKLGKDLITGREIYLTSWRSADDPSPGEYTVKYVMVKNKYPQLYITKNSVTESRIGPYNGIEFAGQPSYKANPAYVYRHDMVINQKKMYFKYTYNSTTLAIRSIATPAGKFEIWQLSMRKREWMQAISLPLDKCGSYGLCGPYGSCNLANNPHCGCLNGFELKNPEEASPNNWTSGCQRRTPLDCGSREGFLKYSSMKLPDTQNAMFDGIMSLQKCEVACKNNCSCTAYANPNITAGGVGCLLWFGDLIDLQVYPQNGQDIYVRLAASELLAKPNRL